MANSGETIYNNAAGYKLKWLQTSKDTNGKTVKFEMTISPGSYMPVRHLHPHQTETVEVVNGGVRVECEGAVIIVNSGEKFAILPGRRHQWWNNSDSVEAHTIFTVEPAMKFDTMMEQVFGISNKHGSLRFLQIMAMAREYKMYVAGPPILIQKIMQRVLYPVAWLVGHRKFYPEYSSK